TCVLLGKSETWRTPWSTLVRVPSQRSAVSQLVPRTVAEEYRPRVLKRPLPLPQSWRITFDGADWVTLLCLRFRQTLKSPFVRRSSTIGFLLSVPRRSRKTAEMPSAPCTVRLPVSVLSKTEPLVTSTVELYGMGPAVKGAPSTSTVPVEVPVAGGGLGAICVVAERLLPLAKVTETTKCWPGWKKPESAP